MRNPSQWEFVEKPSSFGSDLHLHRNIRQKKRSVKNNQGFPLHYQVILPANLLQSGRQRRAPSHRVWYKHFPTTGSVSFSANRGHSTAHQALVLSHITAGQGSSKPIWQAKALGCQSNSSTTQEPSYPMQLLVKQTGEKEGRASPHEAGDSEKEPLYDCFSKYSVFRPVSFPFRRESGYIASTLHHCLTKSHETWFL